MSRIEASAVCLISLLLTFLPTFACASDAASDRAPAEITTLPISLTVLHVNDTHSYVIPHSVLLKVNGRDTVATAGGYSLLDSAVEDIRSREKNVLLLHAGNVLEGTIWTPKFQGMADIDAMNAIGFDALELGTHDFSKNVQEAAALVQRARFPVLAANMDVSREPLLSGIQPYVIYAIEGEKVGIIGLITPDTAFLGYPGKNIAFLPAADTARRYIAELSKLGVNKIIILSHLGYQDDVRLANEVAGIDVIVGGHTATFMGGSELEQIGLKPEMPYPTQMAGPDGNKVLIVHAWENNRLLGRIKLDFDDRGRIVGYDGRPFIFSTNNFMVEDTWGWGHLCPCRPEYSQIINTVNKVPGFKIYWNSPDMDAVLQPYVNQVSGELNTVIATADENLLRGLNKGPGPLIADALLWSAKRVNPDVQFAIFDSYNMRSDILKGVILRNDIEMVLPLRQSLATMQVRGNLIKMLLELDIDSHIEVKDAFPFLEISGLKMTIDMSRKSGDRINTLQVRQPNGACVDMDMDAEYTMVTTDYLAHKGLQPLINRVNWTGPLADNFKSWIKDYLNYTELNIRDVDAMSDYLAILGNVKNDTTERTVIIKAGQ
ncbi:MAG: 5'-nucleotidase C-terminal domain-containing protein [Dehalococcoidia bacterium]|nr:5'-nucleotidase C-terminal domain-containing protein [Dehalococcoidia bacterium]